MAGNRTASATKEASTTSSAATAPAPVWANAAKANVGVVKKAMTMKDIQEEEERKRKKEREVTTAAKRVAEKPTPPPVATAAAAGPGSAWSTVGSNGKSNRPSSASPSTTGSASGIAGLPPRPSAAAIAGSGMRAPHITSAVASMSATPAAGTAARRPTSAASSPAVSVAKSSTPQSASEDSSQTVSVETLKWMRDTLRGKLQKGITVDEVVGLVLNMHEEDDIADTIWQSSTTLPGKHFAAEFLERRNSDREAGNFASTSRPAPARGSGNTSSGPETSRLQPGSSQDAFGYKVVKKKGRTGKA
ncbi:hypothetical protein FRC20_004238 [Serendipita sp. 405]|nr:hypothetical protein FRC20_004238 [Serendipita sp. 405]